MLENIESTLASMFKSNTFEVQLRTEYLLRSRWQRNGNAKGIRYEWAGGRLWSP